MKQSHKSLILWLVIILVFVAFYQIFQVRDANVRVIPVSTLLADADKQLVREIAARGDRYTAYYVNDSSTVYRAYAFPMTAALEQRLEKDGVEVRIEPAEQSSANNWVLQDLVPMLVLVLMFILLARIQKRRAAAAAASGRAAGASVDTAELEQLRQEVAGLKERLSRLEAGGGLISG